VSRFRQSEDPLSAARERVARHLETTLSTAPTEPFPDMHREEVHVAVLVEPGSIDPDADLMPGFRRGVRVGRADPELRGAVRDLADAVLLLFSVAMKRTPPLGCFVLGMAAALVLAGAGVGAATVAALFVVHT